METQHVGFRGILESRGRFTIEAEIRLSDGSFGLASAPMAIAPGRRERKRSHVDSLGQLNNQPEFAKLRGQIEKRRFDSQADFDAYLEELPIALKLGADVRLALSTAFCRASASAAGLSLMNWLSRLCDGPPAIPKPLLNIFSGGIHDRSRQIPFQEIMFAPDFGSIERNIEAALSVYSAIEDCLQQSGGSIRYSAASGMLVAKIPHQELLDRLQETIEGLGFSSANGRLAIDVAAEHLRSEDGHYCLGSADMTSEELMDYLVELVNKYNVVFLEDPFDPDEPAMWRTITKRLWPSTLVIGDDLFASNHVNIEPNLATGIILKPNQIGTISGVLNTAQAARDAGMTLSVSHRSGETEDTLICDLAVALGAAFIKIGGPRGDRTAKYNQLLRLSEKLN